MHYLSCLCLKSFQGHPLRVMRKCIMAKVGGAKKRKQTKMGGNL